MCRRYQTITHSLLIVSLIALAGCQQTAGTTSNGALLPLPQTNQPPNLLPFGGTTRVSPPPTGAYNVPNNYLGGAVGNEQANLNWNGSGVAQAGFGQNVIGSGVQPSGVQQSGWAAPIQNNTTGLPAQPGVQIQQGTNFGINQQPAANDPRSGGMRAIDLTNAPAPPGYQVPPGYQPPPVYQAPPAYQGGFAPTLQANPAPLLQNQNATGALNFGPAPSVVPPNYQFPEATPGNIAAGDNSNLQWRRPGTQYQFETRSNLIELGPADFHPVPSQSD